MRRALLAVVLVLCAVFASAAHAVIPAPWRYGVVYWVGGEPEYASAYANLITNWAERALGFMGLRPYPRPSGDWERPLEIAALDWDSARAKLPPEFSPRGIVVPGPGSETFWAVPPLLYGAEEIRPLVLVVFPDWEAFQEAVRHYGAAGMFVSRPDLLCREGVWEAWLCQLLGAQDFSTLVVAIKGPPSLDSPRHFVQVLAHELVHWSTWVWWGLLGLGMENPPLLLVEGLSVYAQLVFFLGAYGLEQVPGPNAHPVAAFWAREKGLRDVPHGLTGFVGASLLDFLGRKHGWARVLAILPELLSGWEANLVLWEAEWRRWVTGQIPGVVEVLIEMVLQDLFLCAELLRPLFPGAWDLAVSVQTKEDIDRFWAIVERSWPDQSPELWEKLRRREGQFLYVALAQWEEDEVRAGARVLVRTLEELRERGAWEEYVQAYIRAVKEIIAGITVPVGEAP